MKNNETLEELYAFKSIEEDARAVAYLQPDPRYDFGAES